MAAADEGDVLAGRIAVHYKLITAEQLAQAELHQKRSSFSVRLIEVFLELGLINGEQLKWLLAAQTQALAKRREQAGVQPAVKATPQPAAASPSRPIPQPVDPATPSAPQRARPAAPESARATVRPGAPAAVRATASEAPNVAAAAVAAPGVAASGAPRGPQPAPAAAPEPAPEPSPPSPAAIELGAERRELAQLLGYAVNLGASDVHIHAGAPIYMRLGGRMIAVKGPPLSREEAEDLLLAALTDEQAARLLDKRDLDFAYDVPGVGRFRVNYYRQQRGFDGVFRSIPAVPPTLEQLGLPAYLADYTDFHQGLVLLTGPAGCGKSATLAALLNIVNDKRPDHIITVEDPIETIHGSKQCVVNQRQAAKHTASFARALRAALREDPDVIAIGELRDLETISLAITAAETGHLVLATLHTNNAIRTINRLLDAFPPDQQAQIRTMISESLRVIISQRLVPLHDGSGRVPALEILVVNHAVGNLIRDNKTFQIRSVLQTGKAAGMRLLDDSLMELVNTGKITKEEARRHAEDPKVFA
jgi:twitching motility protein PilT